MIGVKAEDQQELSDINVTPFIDVMLVLLIIFMVVTPLITSSEKIELPKTGKETIKDDKKPVIIGIDKNSTLSIDNKDIKFEDLKFILKEKTDGNQDEFIYFYVDKSVKYEILMDVIGKVKELGYSKIALSAEIEGR